MSREHSAENDAALADIRERIASGNCGEDDVWIVDEVAAWRERFPDLLPPITRVAPTAEPVCVCGCLFSEHVVQRGECSRHGCDAPRVIPPEAGQP